MAARGIGAVIVGFSFALPACAGEEACRLRDADECDVADPDCVEHVRAVVACIRGAEHPLPPPELRTPEAYLAEILPNLPPSDEQAADDPYVIRGLQRLWLLPSPPAPAPTSSGFHDPALLHEVSTRWPMVAEESDAEYALAALVYTLVVADRDAEVDLRRAFLAAPTVDRTRALAALVAGEATFYTDLALARDPDYRKSAERILYTDLLEQARSQFHADIDWTARMNAFQAYFGAHYLRYEYLDGGNAGVSAAYDEALGSTAYVLAGAGVEIDAMFSAVTEPLPPLPMGFRHLRQESLGPVLFLIALAVNPGPPTEREVARAWVGDRVLFIVDQANDKVAVVWQLAAPDGRVAESIVIGEDDETREALLVAFP